MISGDYRRYRGGMLRKSDIYAKGKRNSTFTECYQDGVTPRKETPVQQGKIDGTIKTYFRNGKIKAEKEYKQSMESGRERRFDNKTGEQTFESHYIDGKKDGGEWKIFEDASAFRSRIIRHYCNRKLDGPYRAESARDGKPYTAIGGQYTDGGESEQRVERNYDNNTQTCIQHGEGGAQTEMKVVIIILLLTLALIVSYEPLMPSTDEEMTRRFAAHETAFDKIRKTVAEGSEGSFRYPPLSSCDILILDSAGQISYQPNQVQDTPIHGLSRSDRVQLDSLLSEIGCGLILIDRRGQETADLICVSLFMLYYSHGIMDAGTSKNLVYDLELRSHRDVRITEHGDPNKIYRRTYNDTTLYKPVKEG